MVRNSKRKAFTIVELVIVIAVIAILAAVMIPTFGGVIESANVSADKQMLSGMNSQISIYIGTGNKIETEADLWEALKGEKTTGGTDFTTKLNPKSAKHGYHYFYESASQTVKLLEYTEATEGTALRATGKMLVRAGGLEVRAAGEDFALASPRSFMNGLYFLDKVVDGEGNDFAKLFDSIENLSKTDTSVYTGKKDVIADLTERNRDDNKDFATALIGRLDVTAILTDKDPIKGDKVTHVYIPENVDSKDNYTIKAIGDVKVETDFNANIQIPENVKVIDGCFAALNKALDALNEENEGDATYTEIKIQLDVTIAFGDDAALKTAIKKIFGAESVKGDITINGSMNATIDGVVVKIDGKEDIKLDYLNPVTEDFSINVPEKDKDGNITNVIYDQYIALNKIQDGTIKVSVKNSTLAGKSGDAFCQDVKWEIVGESGGATIDENTGVVTFPTTFELAELTIKATPVAVNEGQENIPVATKTLKVLKLSNDVTFNFATNNKTYTDLTVSLGENADRNQEVVVKYSDGSVFANFSNIKFYYVNADGSALNQALSADDLARLGMPEAKISVEANEAFNMDGFVINFNKTNIAKFKDAVTQTVQLTVGQDVYDIDVKMEPSIFGIGYTAYNDFVYTVGDDNPVAPGKLFALSDFFGNVTIGAEDKVYIQPFNVTYDGQQNEVKKTLDANGAVTTVAANIKVFELGQNWATTGIQLSGLTNYLEIRVNDSTATFGVKINLVDGKNVTTAAEFVGSGNVNLVLHSNIGSAENDRFTPGPKSLLSLDGKSIYGNYFKVVADNLYDTDFKDGNAFISMKGGSLNQFILEGPVYARGLMRALDDKDKQSGFFYFGVAISGSTVEFNDSYLSGFNSPVFVSCVTFNANDTYFEGGAWSNIYIRSGVSEVNFHGVKTIQNRDTGYKTDHTKDEWTNASSAGMGIFVHNSQASGLVLNLNDTEQHNWFKADDKNQTYAYASKNAMDGKNLVIDSADGKTVYKNQSLLVLGGLYLGKKLNVSTLRFTDANYLREALSEVFDGNHTTFYHKTVDGTDYVNTGIISIEARETPSLDLVIDGPYHSGTGYVGIDSLDLGLGVKVWTIEHNCGDHATEDETCTHTGLDCCKVTNYRTFDNFAECIEKDFLANRLPK